MHCSTVCITVQFETVVPLRYNTREVQSMQKKAVKHKFSEESLEAKHTSVNAAVTDISSAGLDSLWKDLLGGSAKDMVGQLFGAELKPGEAQSLKKEAHEVKKEIVQTESHMEYFRTVKNADIAPGAQLDAETKQRVDDIRQEIKKLMDASTELENTFKSVIVEQRVVKAGKYHETFFTFVLSLLRTARIRMEEGNSWLQTKKTKKQQQQYKSMAKKHGTSFTLNNERTAATQTG